jgi:predicted phage terminase large subunit-like protein
MFEEADRTLIRDECEVDHLFFTQYFFKLRQNIKFKVNFHHAIMADCVQGVIDGRIKNLVITVSPGSSKTELVVINLIARGLALNPWSRFLHLSGSDSLAGQNSATAREIVRSDEFQSLWPMHISEDADSKKRWNVMVNGQIAGGVYATSIGGQVTGFRAGHMASGFQGAIIIDDPIKPEDAFSRPKLERASRQLVTTVKSRKANPDTPIILIMQRIASHDPVGFIESGNLGRDWTFVKIPAVIDEKYLGTLDPKYRTMIDPQTPQVNGRQSYWPYKEPLDQLLAMERGEGTDQSGSRVSRHVFSSQYQQEPIMLGGNIIKGASFTRYKMLPKIKTRKIFADTAQKTKERNDYSVFACYGLGEDGRLYLIDLIRGKWEAPDLQQRASDFWKKHRLMPTENLGQLRKMHVEDKSSGTGLIQTLKLPPYNVQIEGIERTTDKLTRVMDALPYIEAGMICIPEDEGFTSDFISECEAFTADDTHDFDDQVDTLCDACMIMLSSENKIKQWEALAEKG